MKETMQAIPSVASPLIAAVRALHNYAIEHALEISHIHASSDLLPVSSAIIYGHNLTRKDGLDVPARAFALLAGRLIWMDADEQGNVTECHPRPAAQPTSTTSPRTKVFTLLALLPMAEESQVTVTVDMVGTEVTVRERHGRDDKGIVWSFFIAGSIWATRTPETMLEFIVATRQKAVTEEGWQA